MKIINTQQDYYTERERLIELIRIGNQAKAELSRLEHMFPVKWDMNGEHNPLHNLPMT